MERRVFFVDKEGRIIENEDINFHESLAELIIKHNEELLKSYKQSKIDAKTLFLILEEGYFAGVDSERYKEISFYSPIVSQRQLEILLYYHEEGYNLHNYAKEYEKSLKRMNEQNHEEEEK